jgi:hypothetical protein
LAAADCDGKAEVIMPLDGSALGFVEDERLVKLNAVERLLATPDQWCKGKLRSEDGRRCLLGAMQAVEARQLLEPIILQAASEVSRRRCWRVEFFNDDPRTTHADVMQVLSRARERVLDGLGDRERPRSWHERLVRGLRQLVTSSVYGPAPISVLGARAPHRFVPAPGPLPEMAVPSKVPETETTRRAPCEVA